MPNYFQRLEKALQERGLSKGALATHLQVALSTISRWKRAMPRAETVQKTADFLGVSAQWLMTGDAEKSPKQARFEAVIGGTYDRSASSQTLKSFLLGEVDRRATEFFGMVRLLAEKATTAADQIHDRRTADEIKIACAQVVSYEPFFGVCLKSLIDQDKEDLPTYDPPPEK
jgi:transcriptional regulator with XRE-family HTH domain